MPLYIDKQVLVLKVRVTRGLDHMNLSYTMVARSLDLELVRPTETYRGIATYMKM